MHVASPRSTKENTPHIMPVSSVRQGKAGKQDGGDSDDSLVGEHSPFVRTGTRRLNPEAVYTVLSIIFVPMQDDITSTYQLQH